MTTAEAWTEWKKTCGRREDRLARVSRFRYAAPDMASRTASVVLEHRRDGLVPHRYIVSLLKRSRLLPSPSAEYTTDERRGLRNVLKRTRRDERRG